jgi:hypothetical protein
MIHRTTRRWSNAGPPNATHFHQLSNSVRKTPRYPAERADIYGNDDRIESEERDGRLQSGFRRLTMSGPTRHGSGKEVIQPQVPLRLPCYDFAPVTALAFGGLLLTVATPTSGTHSFHGVTGGVYKARERIHRDVADSRLLAIPASCRRVADDNPN